MKRSWSVAVVFLGVAVAAGAGQPASPQTVEYEFSEQDMQIMAQKLVDSLLATADLPADPAPRIGWLRLRNDTESKSTPIGKVMETVETAIIKSKRLQVVSRSSLQAIADENALSMTFQDPAVAEKLSMLASVDYWLSGTLRTTTNREEGKEYTYYNLSVSLTQQGTTAKVWADTAEIKKVRNLQLFEKTRVKGRVKN